MRQSNPSTSVQGPRFPVSMIPLMQTTRRFVLLELSLLAHAILSVVLLYSGLLSGMRLVVRFGNIFVTTYPAS